MKTITFYSYKGGTGRSLAITQLAACLASMGRQVWMLDLDFDAQGLLHKSRFLGAPLPHDFGSGMLEIIQAFVEEAIEKEDIRVCSSCGQIADVSITSQDVTLASLEKSAVRVDYAGGSIHLLHAGDIILKPDAYCELLNHPHTVRFLNDERSDPFFRLLLKKIATCGADYVLIDSRSGLDSLAYIAAELADKLIVLTANHQEGYNGTKLVVERLEATSQASTQADFLDRVHLVLARFPEYFFNEKRKLIWLGEDKEQAEIDSLLSTVNSALKQRLTTASIFHSDPFLEYREKLPIDFRADPELARAEHVAKLAEDYKLFFSGVFKVEEPEMQTHIEHHMGEVRIMRPYFLDPVRGLMFNPEDEAPNVSFRVITMLTMLESLYNAVRNSASEQAAERALFNAGRESATTFSDYLEKEQFHEASAASPGVLPDFSSRLRKWCKFDNSVGFGLFTPEPSGDGRSGQIHLVNSFLIYGRTAKQPHLCAFMSGYISRILETVFGMEELESIASETRQLGHFELVSDRQSLRVTHEKGMCGQFETGSSGDDPVSVFTYSAVI